MHIILKRLNVSSHCPLPAAVCYFRLELSQKNKTSRLSDKICCTEAQNTQKCAMQVLVPALEGQRQGAEQAAKVTRWLDACAEGFPKKKMSAGAMRDSDRVFDFLRTYTVTNHLPAAERLEIWSANLWCALHFVVECRIICRGYAHTQAWYRLEASMLRLAKALSEVCETDAEAIGANLYIEGAL